MKNVVKPFNINFSALKLGEHKFDYKFDNQFFKDFLYEGFLDATFNSHVMLTKKESALELAFTLEGQVLLNCDLTNEEFWHPLTSETKLQVKFGQNYDDTNDEILILPEGEHTLNVAQYFYELAVLAKPLKVIHPDVLAGKKGQDVLKKLEELSPENSVREEKEEIDPRWNKLKDLLN